MQYKVLKYAVVDAEIIQVINYYKSISSVLGNRVKHEILNALYDLKSNAHHYLILADKKHRRDAGKSEAFRIYLFTALKATP